MVTSHNKFRIFKFEGLTKLMNTNNYDDYLIICLDGEEKVWYPFEEKILWDSYKDYFKEKLGITDPAELQILLDEYNSAVKDKSYGFLKEKNLRKNKYKNTSGTDKDIKLSTRMAKDCRGMKWYKNNGGNKNGYIN